MRHPREITAEEENYRLEEFVPGHPEMKMVKRDPVKPEPTGTYVLMAFRIDGYDPDCDGALMWRGPHVHFDDPDETTGWTVSHLGLYRGSNIIVTADELRELYRRADDNQ